MELQDEVNFCRNFWISEVNLKAKRMQSHGQNWFAPVTPEGKSRKQEKNGDNLESRANIASLHFSNTLIQTMNRYVDVFLFFFC